METVKIECTEDVGIKGVSYARGQKADVSEADARLLVGIGRARYVDAEVAVEKPEERRKTRALTSEQFAKR